MNHALQEDAIRELEKRREDAKTADVAELRAEWLKNATKGTYWIMEPDELDPDCGLFYVALIRHVTQEPPSKALQADSTVAGPGAYVQWWKPVDLEAIRERHKAQTRADIQALSDEAFQAYAAEYAVAEFGIDDTDSLRWNCSPELHEWFDFVDSDGDSVFRHQLLPRKGKGNRGVTFQLGSKNKLKGVLAFAKKFWQIGREHRPFAAEAQEAEEDGLFVGRYCGDDENQR